MLGKSIRIIGIPMDLGQNRRGVDMGPSALRYAGLQSRLLALGHQVHDEGNVHVPNPEESAAAGLDQRRQAVGQTCQNLYEIGRQCVARDELAIYLGGDHSISIGSVAASAAAVPSSGQLGLIWIDAHADFNTVDTSPSGNIHGMPVAVLTGDGHRLLVDVGYPGHKISPANIVQIGLRDLDAQERVRLAASGMHVFTMRHIDELGMAAVAEKALNLLAHVAGIHISLDMDSLDPAVAPGVGTPVPGGLTYREAHLLMEILGESGRIGALDIVEINPILDNGNRTAELAVGLAASLLGKQIL
jgi:arginase